MPSRRTVGHMSIVLRPASGQAAAAIDVFDSREKAVDCDLSEGACILAKDLAIVLNSGSINSAVSTALAAQKFRPILLHAEIAPQPGSRIRAAYDQQVAHFKPYREHTLPMPFLAPVQPGTSTAMIASDPRISTTLSPQMLELLPLLSAAVKYAAHYGAAAIYLGIRIGSQGDELAQATEYIQ